MMTIKSSGKYNDIRTLIMMPIKPSGKYNDIRTLTMMTLKSSGKYNVKWTYVHNDDTKCIR